MEKLIVKEITVIGFALTPQITINDDHFFVTQYYANLLNWLKYMNSEKNKKNLFLYVIIHLENDLEIFLANESLYKKKLSSLKKIYTDFEKVIIELDKFNGEKIEKGKKKKIDKMNFYYNKFFK